MGGSWDQKAPFNPFETIQVDMRAPLGYIYGYDWKWASISKGLSLSQMRHTCHRLLGDVYGMAEA
jgi:hypothetical protein